MSHGKKESWFGYRLGLLHAAEHLWRYGYGVAAVEMVTHLLSGVSVRSLQRQARREKVELGADYWSEVRHRLRLTGVEPS